MNAASDTVLAALAKPGKRAVKLARVIARLVTEGAEHGEFVDATTIGRDGAPRTIKLPPAIWFTRLARALDRGAFEKMDVDQIVQRIFTTQPEDAAA